MDFSIVDKGETMSLVAEIAFFDPSHEAHMLVLPHSGALCKFQGLLDDGFWRYTICDAEFVCQFPLPILRSCDKTRILSHTKPAWCDFFKMVDACSGAGGIAHGALAAGIQTVVAVDANDRMLGLHQRHDSCEVVHGNIGSTDVIIETWHKAQHAAIMCAGYSCQPFSQLGDKRGGSDPRAASLSGVLKAAVMLQTQVLVLECVSPAKLDPFVVKSIDAFVRMTGFHKEIIDLKLDSVWPSRRTTTWWVLSSKLFGPVQVQELPVLSNLEKVHRLMPYVCQWNPRDEMALALDQTELVAFGWEDGSYARHMLTPDCIAPTALHAWGSQVRGCECGCRAVGLSPQRLEEKGLFGCLLQSSSSAIDAPGLRHLHPCEAQLLNGVDPMIDFGENVRLALSAIGQIASPLQAAWILSFVVARIDVLTHGKCMFPPLTQLHAFRSWLVARSQLVWPCNDCMLDDPKFVDLVSQWMSARELFLPQLLDPSRWPCEATKPISIAEVLDCLIRSAQVSVRSVPVVTLPDEEETPVFDFVTADPKGDLCISQEQCVVSFIGSGEFAVFCSFAPGATIAEMLQAHAKLVGPFWVGQIGDRLDHCLSFECGLEVGQHVQVELSSHGHGTLFGLIGDEGESGLLPRMPDVSKLSGGPLVAVDNDAHMVEITPTAALTEPCSSHDDLQTGMPSSDVGVSIDYDLPFPQGRCSASALLGLDSAQFLNLQVPTIADPAQLFALRSQVITSSERLQLLACQRDLWADDELRFHLHSISKAYVRSCAKPGKPAGSGILVIDPLITAAWGTPHAFACESWAGSHPEVLRDGMQVIGVFRIDNHWVPVQFVPCGHHLNVHTWDSPVNSHADLNRLIERLSEAWGFKSFLIHCQQRLFFTCSKCGALAIHFLHYALLDTQLPHTSSEADAYHDLLRTRFAEAIQSCQVTLRPWVWGSGDDESSEHAWPSEAGDHDNLSAVAVGAGSSSDPAPGASVPLSGAYDPTRSHTCIPLEDRLDLLHTHGLDMADDEIRFHLQVIIGRRNEKRVRETLPLPVVLMFEPLNFLNWDEVGHIITEKWCCAFPQVRDEGHQIVSALWIDGHWIPLWFVPGGRVLVVHTFNEIGDYDGIDGKLRWMGLHLGFEDVVIHRIPNALPPHNLCGAHAMAFIAHVLLEAPLPETVADLRTMHSNMRAHFVQEIYADQVCRCPLVWGAGGTGALVKSLSEELLKHGVPPQLSEARASQAIRAIGSEQLIQALQAPQPWRQLKALANNVSFKFVLPSELAAVVASNKSKPVGKKSSKDKPAPGIPPQVDLDLSKIQVLEGAFRAQGRVLPQLQPQQIGPVSSGFVLMSAQDAEPYLRSGKCVSQEPLALVVVHRRDVQVHSMLSQVQCTVPCKCVVDNEPLLVEATIVQIGTGTVEKFASSNPVSLEQPEVNTVKISVFRDEYAESWESFSKAPIRSIVQLLPELKRCDVEGCTCIVHGMPLTTLRFANPFLICGNGSL